MKKVLQVLAIIAVVGCMVSCKAKEKCPAYGNMSKALSAKVVRS